MKNTTYIVKITTQKNEIHLLASLLTSLPRVNQEIFPMSLLKSVLPFLTNQAA